MIGATRDSGGLVGLNLATSFLRPDGAMRPDTELEVVVQNTEGLVAALTIG